MKVTIFRPRKEWTIKELEQLSDQFTNCIVTTPSNTYSVVEYDLEAIFMDILESNPYWNQSPEQRSNSYDEFLERLGINFFDRQAQSSSFIQEYKRRFGV